jgi:hypothetical protein
MTWGADKRDPASSVRATGSAWVALEAGLIRTALPLLLLSSGYCSHCRRDNIRTTS